MEYITPGVVIDGQTYYPTGAEWLLAFALAGCEWARLALVELEIETDHQRHTATCNMD